MSGCALSLVWFMDTVAPDYRRPRDPTSGWRIDEGSRESRAGVSRLQPTAKQGVESNTRGGVCTPRAGRGQSAAATSSVAHGEGPEDVGVRSAFDPEKWLEACWAEALREARPAPHPSETAKATMRGRIAALSAAGLLSARRAGRWIAEVDDPIGSTP